MRPLHLLVVLLAHSLALTAKPEGSTAPNARFALPSLAPLHSIDHRVFGHFVERAWAGERGAEAISDASGQPRADVVAILRDKQIPSLRFPGGGMIEAKDRNWPDLIDHAGNRPTGRPPGQHFGYFEFLELCETLRAEPLLVVNFRQAVWRELHLEEAARLAAGLVAYANAAPDQALPPDLPPWQDERIRRGRPAPFGVKVWQIGNEWPVFLDQLAQRGGPTELAEQVAWVVECLVALVDAMKAVDPSIQIIVDGVAWSPRNREFSLAFLAHPAVRARADFVAIHQYRPWDLGGRIEQHGIPATLDNLAPDRLFHALTAVPDPDSDGQSTFTDPILRAAIAQGYRIAMTEWNANAFGQKHPDPITPSLWAKGVSAAGFVHAILRHGASIRLAHQSMLIGTEWEINGIRLGRDHHTPPRLHPTLKVVDFYARHSGAHFLALKPILLPTTDQPLRLNSIVPREKIALVDAVATRTTTTLFIKLINRDFNRSHQVTLDLPALSPSLRSARLHRLNGPLANTFLATTPARLTTESSDELSLTPPSFTLDLPPRTLTVLEIPL
jgi:alpha-L-arabinofuranosidase